MWLGMNRKRDYNVACVSVQPVYVKRVEESTMSALLWPRAQQVEGSFLPPSEHSHMCRPSAESHTLTLTASALPGSTALSILSNSQEGVLVG